MLSNISAIYKNNDNILIYNTNNKYHKIQNIQKCNYNVINNKYVYLQHGNLHCFQTKILPAP